MAFHKMSLNETLGDTATHFFKTGAVLRQPSENLERLQALLPSNWLNGCRVEYDLWYDMRDPKRVHGYVYTDAMGKFVFVRVGDAARNLALMKKAATSDVTPEGEHIFADLGATSHDKYKLRTTGAKHEFVIFLGGANIIEQSVSWDKLHHYVGQGAKLKCHPMTSRDLSALLIKRFGAGAILDKKLSGYDLMAHAEMVGCAENSEMGLVALSKGKRAINVGKGNNQLTYAAIYQAIENGEEYDPDRFKRILSTMWSGLIPVASDHPKQYVDAFFDYYSEEPHVEPKRPNH